MDAAQWIVTALILHIYGFPLLHFMRGSRTDQSWNWTRNYNNIGNFFVSLYYAMTKSHLLLFHKCFRSVIKSRLQELRYCLPHFFASSYYAMRRSYSLMCPNVWFKCCWYDFSFASVLLTLSCVVMQNWLTFSLKYVLVSC